MSDPRAKSACGRSRSRLTSQQVSHRYSLLMMVQPFFWFVHQRLGEGADVSVPQAAGISVIGLGMRTPIVSGNPLRSRQADRRRQRRVSFLIGRNFPQ